MSTAWCEFESIVQKIRKDLLQPRGIADNDQRSIRGSQIQSDPVGISHRPYGIHDNLDERRQIDPFHVEVEFACIDSRKIQKRFHQLRFRSRISLDDPHNVRYALSGYMPFLEHRHPTGDGAEW